MHGSRLGQDKGYEDRKIVGRYLGGITWVPFGGSVGVTDSFIGDEDLGLTYERYVATKVTS